MALLSSILGFSLFGLSARVGQLGIQKRNLLESTSSFPLLHVHPLPYHTKDLPASLTYSFFYMALTEKIIEFLLVIRACAARS
jgi:hypothetical protein